MCALRWDERPSPDHTSRIQVPVFRVPKSGKCWVWLLGPFRGLWTHYIRKKTLPCLTRDCPHCDSSGARWKGYAPALVWLIDPLTGKGGFKPCVLEITEKVQDLAEREDLVGTVVMLGRLGTKPNGPLYYEPAAAHLQPKGEPKHKAFDVEPILEQLFDVAGRHLRPTLPEPTSGEPVPELKLADPEAG